MTCSVFLCAVRAEKDDSQGYGAEQTKGTTVTKDLLVKEENTTGHGTAAIPTENMLRHAKFPGADLFDTRPAAPDETTQTTKAPAVIAPPSRERFVSRDGQNSHTSTTDNPSAGRIHTEPEFPLIPNYEENVFSSAHAEFESMMNGSSEPEVHLSADVLKAPLWLNTLLDKRNQRNTDSITLTSADRGPGVPVLSASHPRVIDNLAALRNDNDEKRSQGKDEKGISNLDRNDYPFSTVQSIFQSDTGEDSVRGNTVTNLCLTCLKDRRLRSTEKSVALPAPSPQDTSDSPGIEGLALDSNQFKTSLPSLHQQPIGKQEVILNKDISHPNISKHSSFGVKEELVYNLTFASLSYKKTMNHSQGILNTSQIKAFLTDTATVAFDRLARNTYATRAVVTERPISTSAAFYRSSKPLYTVRKPVRSGEQEMFGIKVSVGDPQSQLIDISKNTENASHSLSTNTNHLFIRNISLDGSSGSVSKTHVMAEKPHSSQESILPEGIDHSTAIHPTSAVKHPESRSLTGRADSLISVLSSQTPAKPNSQTKEPVLTLLLKDTAIKFASVTTKRHLTDTQDSHTLNTVKSIVKQAFVDASGPASKPVMTDPQTPTVTAGKVVVPFVLSLPQLRQDFDDDASTFTLTTLSSKPFPKGLIMSKLLGSQSKITPERSLDATNDNRVASTRQSFVQNNTDLIRESVIVHNLKLGDKNKQVLTVVAEDEDKQIIKTEGEHSKDIKETKEILKLEEEEDSMGDELGNKRAELFGSDKMESGKKDTTEEGEGNYGEEDVTLRQKNAPRQEEVRDEEGVAEKQRESLASREGTASMEDFKHSREIGRKAMTNVPPGPPSNSKELNRDKGLAVANLSSSHSLIKQLGTTTHRGIHLGDDIAQIVEIKNKPFPDKVTSTHRPLHSAVRSQTPRLSRVTSIPKEPYTQIKPHPSRGVLPWHRDTSSLPKVADTTFSVTATTRTVPKLSQTFVVGISRFSDVLKPRVSANPELNSIDSVLSLKTPPLAATAGFLRAQPHFTENSSTLSASIIYSASDHRYKFGASVSKEKPLSQTTNESGRAKHITPAHIFESRVKDPLTSNIIEDVNLSTSVNPAQLLQMYNDSLTTPPTTGALSFEAHISVGKLRPHQLQSAPQISQSSSSSSSSFDMTSSQPCSFKLSEQTAHSDALHAPVDDNKQRSVQTLMASMSPKAKSDQFPLGSVSPQLNLVIFGGDSLPDTYGLTELTRSASAKEIVKANSNAEYVNNERGHAESLLGTAADTNQTEENDGLQEKVTLADAVTKHMAERRGEKNDTPFVTQTTDRRKNHVRNTEEFSSSFVTQIEKPAVKNTDENSHNELQDVGVNDEANNILKATPGNNHLAQLEGLNETNAQPILFAIQISNTKQAINEDFDKNDPTGTTAFAKSDNLQEIPQMQSNDALNNAFSDMEYHAAKTIEKQAPSTPQGTLDDNTLPVTHINFKSDLQLPNTSSQQSADRIINVTSDFRIIATETSDFVSLPPTGLIVSMAVPESALTMTEHVQVVIEKPSQAANAECMAHPSIHIESLPRREPLTTVNTSKLTPAVNRKNRTETQSLEKPEHEISAQAIEQSQHQLPSMIPTRRVSDPGQGIQTGLLNAAHRAGEAHDSTPTMVADHSSFKVIETAVSTKSSFEAKHPLHERNHTHTLDGADKHNTHALPEKTSISQVILGAVTDSVPPTAISPIEIINETSCRTIGCAKSGGTTETTIGASEIDHTAPEKMDKTQAENTAKDHFNAAHTPDTKPENGNCSTGCPGPGKASPQATNLAYSLLSPATSKSDHDPANVDGTATKSANSMTYETSTKTLRALVETNHLERRGTLEQGQFAEKTAQKQSHRESSKAHEAIAAGVTLSEPEATTAQTTVESAERTLLAENNTKTQLKRAKAEIFEAQNATRSTRAVSEEGASIQESVRRLLLPEPESELPRRKHRRRTSPLHLSG